MPVNAIVRHLERDLLPGLFIIESIPEEDDLDGMGDETNGKDL